MMLVSYLADNAELLAWLIWNDLAPLGNPFVGSHPMKRQSKSRLPSAGFPGTTEQKQTQVSSLDEAAA